MLFQISLSIQHMLKLDELVSLIKSLMFDLAEVNLMKGDTLIMSRPQEYPDVDIPPPAGKEVALVKNNYKSHY